MFQTFLEYVMVYFAGKASKKHTAYKGRVEIVYVAGTACEEHNACEGTAFEEWLIDKFLKSPNCTHIVCAVLAGAALIATVEGLTPGDAVTGLTRTPIVGSGKTPNFILMFIQFI